MSSCFFFMSIHLGKCTKRIKKEILCCVGCVAECSDQMGSHTHKKSIVFEGSTGGKTCFVWNTSQKFIERFLSQKIGQCPTRPIYDTQIYVSEIMQRKFGVLRTTGEQSQKKWLHTVYIWCPKTSCWTPVPKGNNKIYTHTHTHTQKHIDARCWCTHWHTYILTFLHTHTHTPKIEAKRERSLLEEKLN